MTTIKFPRPDGEARLTTPGLPVDFSFSWRPSSADAYQPDGGFVLVECRHGRYAHFPRGIGLDRELAKFVDPVPVIAEAEKLRNEKRKLLSNEWRHGDMLHVWSKPTLEGVTVQQFIGGKAHSPRLLSFKHLRGFSPDYQERMEAYHRTAFLPILPADHCYPPGELPRRMTDDEVRFPDGSAGRMVIKDRFVCIFRDDEFTGWNWTARDVASELPPDHPAHNPSQLARLQAFWDANQPKEAELNLRWASGREHVLYDAFGGRAWVFNGDWQGRTALSPSQRATVEAFFAAGPPVELAEDEFKTYPTGYRCKMRVRGERLEVRQTDGSWYDGGASPWVRAHLALLATENPYPLGWPRALAYFDRHVGKPTCPKCNGTGRSCGNKHCEFTWCTPCVDCGPLAKPEPARVTDVRLGLGRDVDFTFKGRAYFYYGEWCNKELHAELHPLDIALIERCWAEGRLGEREVLDDAGKAWEVKVGRESLYLHAGPGGFTLGMSFPELASDKPDCWAWVRDDQTITVHDPIQRARVRAIAAGMQQDSRASQEVGAQPGDAQESAVGVALPIDGDAHMQEAAVVTEAHSVTPSGERRVKIDRPWSEYPLGAKAFAAGGGHWTRVTNGWKWCSGSTFPTPGGDAVSVEVPESIPPHVPGPGKLYGPEVTPSGEVKAPFGLEWAKYGCQLAVRIGGLQITRAAGARYGWYCTGPADTGDPETFLRNLHAALSDHIRRGDSIETDDRASMWQTTAMCEGARREQAERERDEARDREIQHLARAEKAERCEHLAAKQRDETQARNGQLQARLAKIADIANGTIKTEPAADLTELREALKVWNDEGPWTASEQLAAAVERLVGK